MQLQNGNEVPDGSDDGEAQDRVNMDPWVLPCAVGEALVLWHRRKTRPLPPELQQRFGKEVSGAAAMDLNVDLMDVDDNVEKTFNP